MGNIYISLGMVKGNNKPRSKVQHNLSDYKHYIDNIHLARVTEHKRNIHKYTYLRVGTHALNAYTYM